MTARAVILGIDQGRDSGIAVLSPSREILTLGIARTVWERAAVLRFVRAQAVAYGVPAIAVLEDHSKIPLLKGQSTATILGLGEARGRWKEVIELDRMRYAATAPNEWRKAVLGIPNNTPRDTAKALAVQWAAGMLRTHSRIVRRKIKHDEAEALAIGWFGLHAPHVADLAQQAS